VTSITAGSTTPDGEARHGRLVSAFQILPEAVDDVRAIARDFRATSDAYGQTRAELGLSEMRVCLVTNAQGSFMIIEIAGDLEAYFRRIRTDGGVDSWMREKLAQWVGSAELAERLYQFPETEELLSWRRAKPSR
jgi:hypothetical protein